MRKLYTLILLFFFTGPLMAQDDCGEKLLQATRAYYNGNLREVEPLLEGCLQGKRLDDYQKTEAYKLLVNTYLVLREDEKANEYMFQLLKHNPEYKLRTSDIIEFRKLQETYEIQTQFNYGFIAGFNIPDYQVLRYQSYASETQEPSDYTELGGLVLGATADKYIWKGFFVRASLMYMNSGFRQEEIILNYQKVGTEEREHRLNLPVELGFVYEKWKFRPFVSGGVSMHYLIKSSGNIDHIPIPPPTPNGSPGIPFTVRDYDLTDQRTRFSVNWVASAGVQRKIGKFTIEARFSYEYGINNLVNEEERYIPELLDIYAYVPDDYKMDSYRFTLGFYRTISKPVKK